MGHFHFCDKASILPGFLISGDDRVWVAKRRKLPVSMEWGCLPAPRSPWAGQLVSVGKQTLAVAFGAGLPGR